MASGGRALPTLLRVSHVVSTTKTPGPPQTRQDKHAKDIGLTYARLTEGAVQVFWSVSLLSQRPFATCYLDGMVWENFEVVSHHPYPRNCAPECHSELKITV